jgi:cell division protein ZapA (FtsZ GTPase activity inhibitor)
LKCSPSSPRKRLSKAKPRKIEVEIYDQKYSIILKTPLPETEVRKLADDVDSRMRDIAAQANTPDSLKVAILTALHLAQEYKELQQRCEQKTEELSRALEAVLK